MKLPSFLLVGSLVANAVLLTWWLAPDRASAALTAHNSSTRAPTTAAPSLTPRAAPSALTPAALREHLTSLGLPPAAVTALVRARLYAPHDARRRELLTAASQSLPWWKFAKRPPTYDSSIHLTPAERKELHDLEAEARAATLATLGPVPLDPTGSIAARYAFLSPEKAVLLDALEQDYRNLRLAAFPGDPDAQLVAHERRLPGPGRNLRGRTRALCGAPLEARRRPRRVDRLRAAC